ncbi:SLATT domain-containing protein [Edwardsiella tarda]|uniref:SLATT domain-containing protein n=1 Tax=Edwardsiella tarda TaxID=636 RepID=UPI00351C4388
MPKTHGFGATTGLVCQQPLSVQLQVPQPELASAFTLLALLLTGLMTFLKPNERAAMHRAAAGQFLALRYEARFFREIELLETDRLGELLERLKALSSARNELNQKSPSIMWTIR